MARARGTSVGDFHLRFAVEPQLIPELYAPRDGRRHGVVHYQGVRVRPALGACAAASAHPVNMLTDEQQYSRLPDAASMQLCGCATPLRGGVAQPHISHVSRPQLVLSQPGSLHGCWFVRVAVLSSLY